MNFHPIPGPSCPEGPTKLLPLDGPSWAFRRGTEYDAPIVVKRSCNHHDDCDAAEAKERAKMRADFDPRAMHCHSVECLEKQAPDTYSPDAHLP